MSEKSPFCPLALEEHTPLKTEFLTRSKRLTPKEVESKLFCMLPHPNKGGTSLKVCKLTLGMGFMGEYNYIYEVILLIQGKGRYME